MTLITHLLDPIIDALGRVTLLFGVTFVFDDLSDPLLIGANLWLGTFLFHPVAGWLRMAMTLIEISMTKR